MKFKQNRLARRLSRPSDAFLPIALMLAALMGREAVAFKLFIAIYAVRLCALASADGLRAAFARQPAVRYVQGSVAVALALQFPGAIIAAAMLGLCFRLPDAAALALCGLLINIEHVFYEYLFSMGDEYSAFLCRGLTSLMSLTGLMLCAPAGAFSPALPIWLLLACGLSAAVGMTVGLSLGAPLKPRVNGEVLRLAPFSILQTALYPALALTVSYLLKLGTDSTAPLCAGLALYELCRTPFRRTPVESTPLSRSLCAVCGIAAIVGIAALVTQNTSPQPLFLSCCALILASMCAFALYGSLPGREVEAT